MWSFRGDKTSPKSASGSRSVSRRAIRNHSVKTQLRAGQIAKGKKQGDRDKKTIPRSSWNNNSSILFCPLNQIPMGKRSRDLCAWQQFVIRDYYWAFIPISLPLERFNFEKDPGENRLDKVWCGKCFRRRDAKRPDTRWSGPTGRK